MATPCGPRKSRLKMVRECADMACALLGLLGIAGHRCSRDEIFHSTVRGRSTNGGKGKFRSESPAGICNDSESEQREAVTAGGCASNEITTISGPRRMGGRRAGVGRSAKLWEERLIRFCR